MTKDELISEIIRLQSEITTEVILGYDKSSVDDHFKSHREKLRLYRCLYFGYDSKYCEIKKGD